MTDGIYTYEDTIEKKAKKRRVNSKQKGGGFELHVSKMLGEALSPMKFKRSQSSGAILGGRNSKNLSSYSSDAMSLFVGDVVPTNESDVAAAEGWEMRYSVECKFYKTADTLDHLFGNTKIRGWFEQARTDADKVEREPLLVFKFNRTETFCAVNYWVDPPKGVTRSLTLDYAGTDLAMKVFLWREALSDPEWFKRKVGSVEDRVGEKRKIDTALAVRESQCR